MGFGRCYLSGFFTVASTMAVWLWAAKPSQKDRDGEYVSLQGNDITALEQDYLEPVISIIRCVNMIIVYGVVLFFGVDWRIALVIILASIFAILIPRMIGKSLTDARSTYQEQMAEYVTEITDLLEGFRVINQMTVGKILDKHEHVLNETAEKRYQYGKKNCHHCKCKYFHEFSR